MNKKCKECKHRDTLDDVFGEKKTICDCCIWQYKTDNFEPIKETVFKNCVSFGSHQQPLEELIEEILTNYKLWAVNNISTPVALSEYKGEHFACSAGKIASGNTRNQALENLKKKL